ncbi:MAG: hypothetical protein AAF603_04245 [Pseudomonadota bacterium]
MQLMKKTKLHAMGILFGAVFSWFGLSVASASCNPRGCTGQITRIYTKASGTVHIGTDQDETQANCGEPNNVYFTIRPDAVARDMFLAKLISAQAQEKSLYIRIVESTSDCEVMYILMDN